MLLMEATMKSDDLTRALANALLWAPKEVPWDYVLFVFYEDRVTFLTSNWFAAGEQICPCEIEGEDYLTYGKITRADAVKILDRSKAAKSEVTLTFAPRETLAYQDRSEDEDLEFPDTYQSADDGESFDDRNLRKLGELLQDREEDEDAHRFNIDANLLRKFSMIKKEDANITADWWVRHGDPVFVKVGEFSRAVIQPVNRAKHAEVHGEEVLW